MTENSTLSDPAALAVDEVTTRYGKHLILENVSLTVAPG